MGKSITWPFPNFGIKFSGISKPPLDRVVFLLAKRSGLNATSHPRLLYKEGYLSPAMIFNDPYSTEIGENRQFKFLQNMES